MSAKDTANRRWTLIGFVFSTVNPRRLRSANNPIAKIGFVFHLSITLLTTGFEAQTALAFAIEFVFSTVNPGVGSKRKNPTRRNWVRFSPVDNQTHHWLRSANGPGIADRLRFFKNSEPASAPTRRSPKSSKFGSFLNVNRPRRPFFSLTPPTYSSYSISINSRFTSQPVHALNLRCARCCCR